VGIQADERFHILVADFLADEVFPGGLGRAEICTSGSTTRE
jgi:hypothetical protein